MSQRDFDQVQERLTASKLSLVPGLPGNGDVFATIVSAIAVDDFAGLEKHVSETAELRIQGFPEFDGHWRGRADVVEAMARNFGKVTEQKTAVESIVEDGDSLVMLIDETGCMKASGDPYHVRAVIWCTFENGQLHRVEEFSHLHGSVRM